MAPAHKRPLYSAGVIERPDGSVLICRRAVADGPSWELPGDVAAAGESSEAAMRRAAIERVGVDVDVTVGQPPFVHEVDGRPVEYRVFLCGVLDDVGEPLDCPEVRWIHPGQLCEYDFIPPIDQVIAWYIDK